MGRNKMEKEFSEKLNQREIKPTEMAWDRLDAMLTVAENKKPRKSKSWLYIAAGLVGFLLAATLFFNRGNESQNTNQIVHQKDVPTEAIDTVISEFATESKQEIAASKIDNAPKYNQPKSNTFQSINQNQNQIAQSDTSQNQNPNNLNSGNPHQTAQTDSPKADELLAIAQNNSLNAAKPSVKVSAKGLLSQVDGDENLTFREKLLRKVGRNYQNVKVALSNRNVEDENQ